MTGQQKAFLVRVAPPQEGDSAPSNKATMDDIDKLSSTLEDLSVASHSEEKIPHGKHAEKLRALAQKRAKYSVVMRSKQALLQRLELDDAKFSDAGGSWYVVMAGINVGCFQGWTENVSPLVLGVKASKYEKVRTVDDAIVMFNNALAEERVKYLYPPGY